MVLDSGKIGFIWFFSVQIGLASERSGRTLCEIDVNTLNLASDVLVCLVEQFQPLLLGLFKVILGSFGRPSGRSRDPFPCFRGEPQRLAGDQTRACWVPSCQVQS